MLVPEEGNYTYHSGVNSDSGNVDDEGNGEEYDEGDSPITERRFDLNRTDQNMMLDLYISQADERSEDSDTGTDLPPYGNSHSFVAINSDQSDTDQYEEIDVDEDEIDWPEGIEPFDPANFDPEINGHDLPALIEDFDAYLTTISDLGIHPIVDLPEGRRRETHVDVPTIMLSALACVARLASNPALDLNDSVAVQIHGICRSEWEIVIQTTSSVLPAIAQREAERRALQWPGPTATDLYLELGSKLRLYPRMENVEDPADRAILEQNPEVMRFRADVDRLIRWIVTQAAIEYRANSSGDEDEMFDPKDWWLGLSGAIM